MIKKLWVGKVMLIKHTKGYVNFVQKDHRFKKNF